MNNDLNFHEYGKIYDAIYKGKNYKEESRYINEWIQLLNPNAKNILDLGAGTGRHCKSLGGFGYNIFGVEKSPQMVAVAKKRCQKDNISIIQGDITSFQIESFFEIVISLFHVMSYQTQNDEFSNVLKNANKHLVSGGYFIFDSWYAPAVFNLKPEKRKINFETTKYKGVRSSTPFHHVNKNIVDVKYEITLKNKQTNIQTSFTENHSMRYFSIPEISYFADCFGFNLIDTEEFLTKKEPSMNTWGVCFILEKVKEIYE